MKARVVVLGASAMDSTRILLNSKSPRFPNGLGNGSDQLGRNFCEQIMVHVRGFLPQLFGRGYTNDDGIGGEHVYVPRFNHRPDRPKPDYLRGFGIQFWNTGAQTTGADVAHALPGFGASFKAAVKKRYPALVSLHPFGEILSRPENRVTVDESRTDRYGVPLMRIDVTLRRERAQDAPAHVRHLRGDPAHARRRDRALRSRGERRSRLGHPRARHLPHGQGPEDARSSTPSTRCTRSRTSSSWTARPSPSASEKNPTLTIVALSWRATDYLAEEMRTGRL